MSPEIVDRRLIASRRILNGISSHLNLMSTYILEKTGTIDFIDHTNKCNLRIHPSESHKLIVQIGTSCPLLALQAALVVQNDVAGINVNCGCPKHFSIVSGMGAALLENQDTLIQVISILLMRIYQD